jgi:plastocyanin
MADVPLRVRAQTAPPTKRNLGKGVHVHINPQTGDVTFHPTVVHVRRGQRVAFRSTSSTPFTIHFRGRSPLPSGKKNIHSTGKIAVTPPLRPGNYHYGIAGQVGDGDHKGKIAIGHGASIVVANA